VSGGHAIASPHRFQSFGDGSDDIANFHQTDGTARGSDESVSPLDAKQHQHSSGTAKPPGLRQGIANCLIVMGDWRDSFAVTV
jgi:hypothetical protein